MKHLTKGLIGIALMGGTALLAESAEPEAAQNTSGVPVPTVPTFDTANPERYGRQLATYADHFDEGWIDEVTSSLMTLYEASGDSVLRRITRMVLENVKEGNKSMVRFVSPAEIKGVGALTHEHLKGTDDNWLYLPSSRRVRRISGANKTASFQGTEFTYEDLSTIEVSKYDW